jgi:hypothetical protein
MNVNRWLLASLAAFAVFFAVEMVVHGILLEGVYKATASLWRSEAEIQANMWMLWLGYAIFAPFFALIYAKGYESRKPALGQGLRFGFYMAMAFSPMSVLVAYATQPLPANLAFYWLLDGLAVILLSGVVVALIYRK